jgi:NitT/TauT family transport system permease protein
MKARRKQIWVGLLSLLVLFGCVLAWQVYVVAAKVPAFLLPAPGAVGSQLTSMVWDGTLLKHSLVTAKSIIIGFALGSILGFVGGYLMSRSRALEDAIFPYVMLIQATPKVALIPLFVIWFGLGMTSKLALVVLSAFFPVMLNTITAVRSTPPEYYDLMTILKASRSQMVTKLEVPLAMPLIMAGLKVGIVQATIGAIVSEWVSGKEGLGYLLVYGSMRFDSRLLVASIIATTLVGLLFYWAVDWVEERVLFWHESKNRFKEMV